MFRHVIVVLLTWSIILGSVLAGRMPDPQPQTKEEKKAANAAARAEREQKRLEMRKEIQELKEMNRNLTKQLNEKTKLLKKCDKNPAAAGADQDELNTLKDQLAAVQAQNQKLTADLQQCGNTDSEGVEAAASAAEDLKEKCQAPLRNVGLNKHATQSSTYDSTSAAQKAVDGNRSPNRLLTFSCSIANPSAQGAWWQVDLGGLYFVDSVFITNRNGFSDETRDYDVRVYTEDPTSNAANTGTLCFHYDGEMRSKETARLTCQSGPIKGRYVRVINSPNSHLTLCEVQVMALGIDAASETCPADEIPENVAPGKTATMSSIFHAVHKASNALDNNFSPYAGIFTYSSCAHTGKDAEGPWWQVDLGKNYKVHYVVIGNRNDGLGKRLKDFSIKVYKENPSINPNAAATLCKFHPGSVDDAAIISLTCEDGPAEGRYVRITNAPGEHLQLCEVEVYATEGSNPSPA
ncbi:uncharacterized protein [Littorina saxatilis]|uniref:uncharacterized protein isoform X2 n=1 Tax=Littorina saxatilis TaxID=31220 RepID=UPI0038B4D217